MVEALQGSSGAIGAGAVNLMKKQRMEAFKFEAMKALTLTVPSQKLSVCELGFQIHSGKLIRLETDTAFTAGREFTPPS